jgi:hypothetical protein
MLGLASCGSPEPTSESSLSCAVPSDQNSSFRGRWALTPLPLAVVISDFDAPQRAAIASAMQTWNEFAASSRGVIPLLTSSIDPIEEVSGTTPSDFASVCSVPQLQGGSYSGQIFLIADSSWSNRSASIVALTTLCPENAVASASRGLRGGQIEVNVRDFFSAGKLQPDMQSVMLHEFGHLLGLDHSCSTGASSLPLCAESPDDYLNAAMYPQIRFIGSTSIQRRELNENDRTRMSCLY